jgi:LEA14-like dessication related protein
MFKQIYLTLIAVSLAIFLVVGTTTTSMLGGHVMAQTPQQQQQQPIKLSVKDISVKSTNNTAAEIQIAFSANNPTKGTVIIEEIQYNVLVDGIRIVSGNIGQRLEGFLTSSATIFPIVSGSEVILKDKQIAHRNSANEAVWNKLIEGKDNNAKIKYLITGTISYKQGSVLEKTGAENDFKLTFP